MKKIAVCVALALFAMGCSGAQVDDDSTTTEAVMIGQTSEALKTHKKLESSKVLKGDMHYTPIACRPTNPSPVGVCGDEVWTGGIHATGNTATQSVQNTDPAGVTFNKEDEVIEFPDGTLQTKVNAVSLGAQARIPFASTHSVVGGTGRYAGATGWITLTGTVFDEDGTSDVHFKYEATIFFGAE